MNEIHLLANRQVLMALLLVLLFETKNQAISRDRTKTLDWNCPLVVVTKWIKNELTTDDMQTRGELLGHRSFRFAYTHKPNIWAAPFRVVRIRDWVSHCSGGQISFTVRIPTTIERVGPKNDTRFRGPIQSQKIIYGQLCMGGNETVVCFKGPQKRQFIYYSCTPRK